MSAGASDNNGNAAGREAARAAAARLLLDVMIERDLTEPELQESLALLAVLLARPHSRHSRQIGSRHPSVSRAMTQLSELEAALRTESVAHNVDNGPVSWECALAGTLAFNDTVPHEVGEITLGEISEHCAEIQRAIDWHQPFVDAVWNGLRLSGWPVFSLGDGRFSGYRGTVQTGRAEPPAPSWPTPDEEARLAHEVRSPLGAIVGFADVIVQQSFGPTSPEMRAGAQRILDTGARLLSALDDMTDAARLDLGRYPVELGWIDARPVIDGAISRFASLAADREAVLRPVGAQAIWMQVDTQALQRLVERLLAGILGLAGQQELFELEAGPIAGDRVAIALTRPACLAGWTSDDLRNPGIEIDSSEGAGRVIPIVGLGFALRLVVQLAERLGGCFTVEPHRFVVNLPALRANGVVSRVRAT